MNSKVDKPKENEIKPGQFVLMKDKTMTTPIKAFIMYKSGSASNPIYDYIPTKTINYNDIDELSIWSETKLFGGKRKNNTKKKYY